MDYVGPAGIPLGWFLGGRNEWDQFSRDAAIAWDHDRKLRCMTCGEYDDDWRDPKGNRLEGRKAPRVVVEHICPGCEALELHANRDEAADRKPGMKRLLVWRGSKFAASPRRRKPRGD